MQLMRFHRSAYVLFSIALVCASFGFLRADMLFAPSEPLRQCSTSALYVDMTFEEMARKYHYIMDQLVEERMRLYSGETPFYCDAETLDAVVPSGAFALTVAAELPYVNQESFSYRDYEYLLHEVWRTYDCHLYWLRRHPAQLAKTMGGDGDVYISGTLDAGDSIVKRERIRVRTTFDRLMSVLRPSEEYLPLHVSLRCLQRSASDVRNAMALLSDVAQCFPERLAQPDTSLRDL